MASLPRKLKCIKRILQNFLSVYILTLVQIKLQEEIEMNMGWNEDAYEMMEHEVKGVSRT
jgi:hypothetical protein